MFCWPKADVPAWAEVMFPASAAMPIPDPEVIEDSKFTGATRSVLIKLSSAASRRLLPRRSTSSKERFGGMRLARAFAADSNAEGART